MSHVFYAIPRGSGISESLLWKRVKRTVNQRLQCSFVDHTWIF
jgi:hypothetical protein